VIRDEKVAKLDPKGRRAVGVRSDQVDLQIKRLIQSPF
jgi:hypothetical protein